jgi:hypothetical protein
VGGLEKRNCPRSGRTSRIRSFPDGDQNLEFQQNLAKRRIGVVVLCAVSNALEDLLPLVNAALAAIGSVRPAEVIRVETKE